MSDMTDPITKLVDRASRRVRLVVVFVILLILSAACVVFSFAKQEGPITFLRFVPLVFAYFMLRAMYSFAVWRSRARRLARLVATEPHRIVWIYKSSYKRIVNHTTYDDSHYLQVRCDDRSTIAVITDGFSSAELDALIGAIYARAPQATIGFTPELYAAFQRDPQSLRRVWR
jgi:hypothetical protein